MPSLHINQGAASRAWPQPGAGARSASGFTVIELMIVLAVVAILAAIAYPSYLAQVHRTRAADAKAVLMQAAQFMERKYTENGTYVLPEDVELPFTKSPVDGTLTYYTIALVPDDANPDDAFQITATPDSNGIEAGQDTLAIDQVGRHYVNGKEAGWE